MFPPERIVCLTEEMTETLYLLGEQKRIVGISGYTVRPPQARREKPRVSAFISADVPNILALEPDLVLTFSDLQADIVAALFRKAISVHAFNQRTVSQILDMIRTLGALVGARDRLGVRASRNRGRDRHLRRIVPSQSGNRTHRFAGRGYPPQPGYRYWILVRQEVQRQKVRGTPRFRRHHRGSQRCAARDQIITHLTAMPCRANRWPGGTSGHCCGRLRASGHWRTSKPPFRGIDLSFRTIVKIQESRGGARGGQRIFSPIKALVKMGYNTVQMNINIFEDVSHRLGIIEIILSLPICKATNAAA
jgi:hypothetical protein